jgi:hypothetical protein
MLRAATIQPAGGRSKPPLGDSASFSPGPGQVPRGPPVPSLFDTNTQCKDNVRFRSEGFPSGQRGQTVNLLAYAFEGSNPSPSTSFAGCQGARILEAIAGVAQW